MLCGGSRASVHLWDHRDPPRLGGKAFRKSSLVLRTPSVKLQQRMKSFSRSHCETPGQIPVVHDCFSQGEDDPELPVERLSPVAGGIVALGKFDTLHIGHRELAIQAARLVRMYRSPIYSSLSTPASVGVDIEAEQRMERYSRCFVEVEKVKACLPSLARRGGLVAKSVLELNLAFQEVSS